MGACCGPDRRCSDHDPGSGVILWYLFIFALMAEVEEGFSGSVVALIVAGVLVVIGGLVLAWRIVAGVAKPSASGARG